MSETTDTPVTDRKKAPRPLQGVVVSVAMDKTAVVQVETRKKHPKYKKTIRRHKKYLAHDEENSLAVNDFVEIMPTRPMSKRKRWRVSKVIRKAV
jgi:small subunit ribosomal protein S17